MASARAALIALLALATTAPASAQLMGTSPPSDPVEPSRTDPEARPREHWGPSRWFLSGVLDVGYLFLRPRFQAGYGTPHTLWTGLEVNPLISGSGVGAYAGARGAIPYGDLRVGASYFYTFTQSFLPRLNEFDNITVRDRSGPHLHYVSLEAQLSFAIPIESTAIVGEVTGTHVIGFGNDSAYPYVFENTLRVVLEPPWTWGATLGYRVRFGDADAFYVQPEVDLVHLVQRDAWVFRIGLRAGIRLWADFEVRVIAMPTIFSPDSLGAAAGDTYLLGARWQWATDTPFGDGPNPARNRPAH